jgi:hypothetical protein
VATPALRPLSVGEILDAGIKVFTRNWKVLVGCTLVPITPFAVLFVLLLASVDPEAFELVPEERTSEPEPIANGFLAAFGLLFLVSGLALVMAYGACFKAIIDAWLGGRPSVKRSLRFGLQRSGWLLLLSIVWMAFFSVAWIPLLVPLVWFTVSWCVSAPAMLVERVGPLKALGRSYRLTHGRWLASLLLILVAYILGSIIGAILQLPLVFAVAAVAGENGIAILLAQIVGYMASFAVTTPYLVAVLTILYFDQRVRKEGFDLQLMVEGLDVERDPDAPAPASFVSPERYTPEQRAAAPYWPPPPGWQPPPPDAPPPAWSSPSGWSAPSPERSGPPPDQRPAEESPWMTPSSGAWAPPTGPPAQDAPDEPPPAARDAEDDDTPRRDRADWLPPDEPRGPGGL